MLNFFQNISHLFAGAGLVLSSLFGHNVVTPKHAITTSEQIKPTVTIQKGTGSAFYRAASDITYQDYHIRMWMHVPQNGGTVTGKISGDCTGIITGQYDGKDIGAINGQADGSCQVLFLQVPGKIIFNGTVNKTEESTQLHVTATVGSFEKSQDIHISFH